MMTVLNRVSVAFCVLVPLSAQAVDRSRLWLPTSYKQYYSELREAANLAEAKAPRCAEVIDGSLSEKLSDLETPIFRLICRDDNRRTHALTVDGLSFEVVDLNRPGGRVTFEQLEIELQQKQEQERLRLLEEERQKLLQQQRDYWSDCRLQLEKKAKNMRSLVWVTTSMPEFEIPEPPTEPEAVESSAASAIASDTPKEVAVESPLVEYIYQIDFDAEDIYHKALHYRGECRYRSMDDFNVRIRPRRD